MQKLLFLSLLLFSSNVCAQDKPVIDWADKLSYGTAATAPVESVVEALKSDNKKCNLLKLALKEVLANGSGIAIKHFVPSQRPCLGCGNDGFPSGHSWNGMVGNNWMVDISFGTITGILRHIANRHTWTQVAAGLALGALSDITGEIIMNHLAVCEAR